MNRAEITAAVARRLDITTARAETAIDAFLDEIATAIATDGRVSLRGFGVFAARDRAARRLLHPRSAKEIRLAARRTVHFRPGAALLRRLKDADRPSEADQTDA